MNGVLLSNIKEWTAVNNTGDPQMQYAEWKKPVSRVYYLMIPFIWYLRKTKPKTSGCCRLGTGGGIGYQGAAQGILGAGTTCVLTVVVVTLIYTVVKTCGTLQEESELKCL